MPTLAERCAPIELLVLDVDGVLTDGHVVLAGAELEIKAFHSRDGSALKVWHNAGKAAAILTGRSSPAVTRRAREIGIEHVVQDAADKLAALQSMLSKLRLRPEQVAAM